MSVLRKWIKQWLLSRDIILSRPPGQFNIDFIKLARAKHRGLDIRFAVDGGANTGEWARELRKIWPAAQVLCVEPRDEAQVELKKFAAANPGVHPAQVLLGKTTELVRFYSHGAQSSMLKTADNAEFGQVTEQQMVRLDDLLERMKLPQPDLIKLDLQGAELPALEGAPRALAGAEMVLLETTFIPFMKDMPLVADTVGFMKERNFRLYDIIALSHRPLDGAMVQGDFLFVREGSKLIADSRYTTSGSVV